MMNKLLGVLAVSIVCAGCSNSDPSRSDKEICNDRSIKSRVETSISTANLPYDFAVNVDRGVVQLSGFVDYLNQAQHAERAARSVPGVKDVLNHIVVRSTLGYKQERANIAAYDAVKKTVQRRN